MRPRSKKVQYAIADDIYTPTGETTSKLSPGYYTPYSDYDKPASLRLNRVISEDIMVFPDSVSADVIENIKKFWASKEIYEKHDFVYKRGILLYGVPGTGKTAIISTVCDFVIKEMNGIVVTINTHDELRDFKRVCQYIRDIEPDTPMVLVFEDIDNLFDGDGESVMLNLLDGKFQLDNVVNIATTNYPEKLAERIINRPSRFDYIREVELPNPEVRRYYLKTKLSADDLVAHGLDEWVDKTEGFSIAHIKEAILSVIVQGEQFESVMERLRNVVKKVYKPISIEKSAADPIGFAKSKRSTI